MTKSARSFRPTVLRWPDLDYHNNSGQGAPINEDPTLFDYKLLAEGDSWFSLNDLLPHGQLPTNILYNLRFRRSTMIISCATPGDTIKNMSTIARNTNLRQALSKDGLKWDAILLSGGGNDFLEDAQDVLLDKSERKSRPSKPEDFCDEEALQHMIAAIQQNYRKIARLRDREGGSARGKPIVTHTYDYVVPRNSPARFVNIPVSGPWIYREFKQAKIPQKHWNDLSNYLLDTLATGIKALADPQTGIDNFHVVDTQGVLTPAEPGSTGESNDWINEFHPSGGGYRKLVRKWHRTLDKVLGS